MRAIQRMFVAGAVLVAIAAPVLAQKLPPGKWWHNPHVVRELDLSAEQRNQLDEKFRAIAPELIDLKAEVEKRALALRGTLDRSEVDAAAVRRAASAVSEARARLFEREILMIVEMHQVLSGEQWDRFRAMIEEHPRRRSPPR